MKLIDKDALIAEIERRIKGLKDCRADTIAGYAGEISGLKNLLSFLYTLEVKKVNLEKEIQSWVEDNSVNGYYREDVYETAEHFFELGLKAQKGE